MATPISSLICSTTPLQIGNVFGTYSVEDDNILLYQKIDDFIVNKLQSWECNE